MSDATVDALYLSDFRQHLSQVEAHLAGNNGEPLQPSYIPPTGYWTVSEKNKFFHALCIHSRLRPDLIAAEIRTKTTTDVCAYIDILEEAISRDRLEQIRNLRDSMKIALEVSERFISWEEENASILVDMDSVPSGGRSSRDDLMKSLDSCHLRAMETMLREAEAIATGQSLAGTEDNQHPDTLIPGSTTHGANLPVDIFRHSSSTEEPLGMPSGEREGSVPANLSTQTRRRLRKRLYMRRKRAENRNEDVNDNVLHKLRPGRKLKSGKVPNYTTDTATLPETLSTTSQPATNAQENINRPSIDDTESFNGAIHLNHSMSGATRPYKIRKILEDNAIDANMMQSANLDLFHLSTIGRLMELYKSCYESDEQADDAAVSVDVIHLLIGIVAEFVTVLVHQSVIVQELERKMKGNIKAWRSQRDEISIENVHQALELIGLPHLNKTTYFSQLLKSQPLGEPRESDETVNNTIQSAYSDCNMESLIVEDETYNPVPFSLYREIYRPAFDISFRSIANSRTQKECSPSVEESMASGNNDDKDMQTVLQDEAEVARNDRRVYKEFEKEFWEQLSNQSPS